MRGLLTWRWTDEADVSALWRLVHEDHDAVAVAVVASTIDVGDILDEMAVLLDEPLAASISPMPVAGDSAETIGRYEVSDSLPAPPTLALPCLVCAVFAVDALRVAWPEQPEARESWSDVLPMIATRLVDRGWRHVAAPGVGLNWTSGGHHVEPVAGWSDATITEIEGPANEALSTHRLWADTRARIDVIVDAPCLDGDPHNGSQALVLNVARALATARPHATIRVAVERQHIDVVEAMLDGEVGVIERDADATADVVYRPYQLLIPAELPWLTNTGRRLVVGQLDMIGFSNPSYHPSPALFHMVRNLQRLTMRIADGVTFISEFGRRHVLVECPDLQSDRCFVVFTGASTPQRRSNSPSATDTRYVLCLSALFWHKNREHAIRTFAAMIEEHGYDGELRIAGPEPFYGRSSAAESRLLDSLDGDVRKRVRYLGRVDEMTKWALLEHADLLIYPSVVEGFGMVPFEAATVGTPCVVAPGSALAEIFDGTGAIVPSWDVRAWAALAALLVNDPLAAADVVAAINARAELYSWSRVAEATWRVIDEVVARPRVRLHHDEGGLRSRMATHSDASRIAPQVHLANRIGAFLRRRLNTHVSR